MPSPTMKEKKGLARSIASNNLTIVTGQEIQ
jgi:hypothetical protein